MNAKPTPKQSVARKKDRPDFTIGCGTQLSMAFIANDLQTTPARAIATLRKLGCPMKRIGNRWFVGKETYLASFNAGDIDPNAAPSRNRKRA